MSEILENRKQLILEHETKLAKLIAREIINKPELSLWMILIPVVFVYYFYGLNKYKKGLRDFVTHFMFSRRLVLDLAVEKVASGTQPDFEELARREKVPDSALEQHRKWVRVLCEFYRGLLESEGDSYAELAKARYGEKGSYLLILNSLNDAEKKFYKALRKHLKETVNDAGDVIRKMEKSLDTLRRNEVDFVFS